ncbi:MAG: IS3 family transposase, partial [Bacilli bacterium]|nr:IS3 family transposase [Bacilli bacterium]
MRWKVEEKLKFIKQYKEAMVVPSTEGYTRKSMRRTIKKWIALYDLYGIDGIAHNKCQVFSYKEKLKAIRLINKGLTYSEVALRFKVRDMSTVSKWHRLYLQYGPKGLLPKPKGRKAMALSQYIDSNLSLHDQCVLYRQLRIREEYVNYIKDEQIKPTANNSYRLIEDLKVGHRITDILKALEIPRSSYYYRKKRIDKDMKNKDLVNTIHDIFVKSKNRYGYRRITMALRNEYGWIVNHKRVLRLMKRFKMSPPIRKAKYKSYKGEIGKVAKNILKRDFKANEPNKKWVTDVTEFHFPWGKVYLSPIMDLYNDEIIAYDISKSPNFDQITNMLYYALKDAPKKLNLIFHSDQGWQYQMKPYQRMLRQYGITQSMSRKGNCLDNAKMEGFFGILKREMFYGSEFNYHNFNQFKRALINYINW